MAFVKAVKSQLKLRLCLVGPSGSGKTYTAQRFAKALSPSENVAVICTERGKAAVYQGDILKTEFPLSVMTSFEVEKFEAEMELAREAGAEVLIIDGLSPAWSGKGGILESLDAMAKRSSSKSTFDPWKEQTPRFKRLIEAIVSWPGHVIVTLRTKNDTVIEKNASGKNVPKKIGIKADFREGYEYEFDVVADIDLEHEMIVSKTRCSLVDQHIEVKPGEGFIKTLLGWLNSGAPPMAGSEKPPEPPPEKKPEPPPPPKPVSDDTRTKIIDRLVALGHLGREKQREALVEILPGWDAKIGMTQPQGDIVLAELDVRVAAKVAAGDPPAGAVDAPASKSTDTSGGSSTTGPDPEIASTPPSKPPCDPSGSTAADSSTASTSTTTSLPPETSATSEVPPAGEGEATSSATDASSTSSSSAGASGASPPDAGTANPRPPSERAAGGARDTAVDTRTLNAFADALDTCSSIAEVEQTESNWGERIASMKRGKGVAAAYVRFSAKRLGGNVELTENEVHFLTALAEMRAPRSAA